MLYLEISAGSDDRTLLIAFAISVVTTLVAVAVKLYVDMRKDKEKYIQSLESIANSIDKGIENNNQNIKEILTNSQSQLNLTITNTLTKFDASIDKNNQLAGKLLEKL